MLRKLIGKIRRQPKQTRDNIAFAVAATFTSVVALVWLVSVPDIFSGQLGVKQAGDTQTAGFLDQISDQAASVKEAFSGEDSPTENIKELIDEYQKTQSTTGGSQLTATDTATTIGSSTDTMSAQTTKDATTTLKTKEPREVLIEVVSKVTTSSSSAE